MNNIKRMESIFINRESQSGMVEQFGKGMATELKESVKDSSKGNQFILNDIFYFIYDCKYTSGIGDFLLNRYNSVISQKITIDIPNDIKLVQALMLEGLVFGYSFDTQKMSLYTLNSEVLDIVEFNKEIPYKKILDMNRLGKILAMRIEITYIGSGYISIKVVNPTKRTQVSVADTAFFPFWEVNVAMKMITGFLKKGAVFNAIQSVREYNENKSRYITLNGNVLKHFCDNDSAIDKIKVLLQPLTGLMYVPVVGAPSTSSMVTKIDLFCLDRLIPITNISDIKVSRVVNPYKGVLEKGVLKRILGELLVYNQDSYLSVVSAMPRIKSMYPDGNYQSFSPKMLGSYYDSLTLEEIKSLMNSVPGALQMYSRYSGLFRIYEEINITGKPNYEIARILKHGIYQIVVITKNYNYSSFIGTNDREVLEYVYGRDYFSKEAFNVVYNKLQELILNDCDVREALQYCGFPDNDEMVREVNSFFDVDTEGVRSVASTELGESLADSKGLVKREESSTGSILVRSIFAIDEGDKLSDYYRYITSSRIVRFVRLY